jgi:Amt family ammonium transporter
VHLACGIWGTLSLGLFAAGKYGLPTANGVDTTTVVTGLLYGGGASQLVNQFIGSAATVLVSFGVSFVVMYAISKIFTLRLHAEREIIGLDLSEHGAAAYPEYVIHGNDGTPKSLDEAKKGHGMVGAGAMAASSGD